MAEVLDSSRKVLVLAVVGVIFLSIFGCFSSEELVKATVAPSSRREPESTPASSPTATEILHTAFEPGQTVYLVPSGSRVPVGFLGSDELTELYISGLSDRGGFLWTSEVSTCDDLLARGQEEQQMCYGRGRRVVEVINCDGIHYYQIEGIEQGDLWVSESQLTQEPIPPVGYLFYLDDEYGCRHLPQSLWREPGEEINTLLLGQPVILVLSEVQSTDIEGQYRTVFTLTNAGTQSIGFDTEALFQAKDESGTRVDYGPKRSRVDQVTSAEVLVKPGQTSSFEIGWAVNYFYRDTIHKIYITVNAPISDQAIVRVQEDSVFLRVELPEDDR